MTENYKRILMFLMFAASGFTGLIYESIWTQYIKLFLGHAAFAQALVLSIFMAGLSLGSWLAAKRSYRFSNPFIVYAVIELIIGMFGIVFHGVYIQATEYSYYSIFPNLHSSFTIQVFQWTLAALLILPQSILLGMTFPIMSAGFVRGDENTAGKNISILYFSNSLGAAVGVLISGYILIANFGLPGTVLLAGMVNCGLALVVYLLSRKISLPKISHQNTSPVKINNVFGAMLLVALFTGLASFLYEIAWIRMLSQVLGASTHAFELMLSAFIFGLAIGSFWIKSRINSIKNPKLYLATIQVIMGFAALITIAGYNQLFDLMEYGFSVISRTEQGYTLFNLLSQFIALLIMLPATIFAGMTLPLLTHILIKEGCGEKSVGLIYASNTIGAITGIIFAVSLGFIYLGSKGIVILGASIDVLVGLFLVKHYFKQLDIKKMSASIAMVVIFFIVFSTTVDFSQMKLTSAVYRTGVASLSDNMKIHLFTEGRTANISITNDGEIRAIRTNGKPDASINMDLINGTPTLDEPTMTMCAILGMAYKPDAEFVANIGMGSGLTTETILSFKQIKKLDTIEIERLMIDAAKLFSPIVTKPFSDPRNNFNITDAKSHFASTKNKYDIIFSEPSNPWVSGISGLFTREFYTVAANNLKDDGLFIQWLHLYESNEKLFGSVVKALSSVMSDYAIYTTNGVDAIIVSKKKGVLGKLSASIFEQKNIVDILKKSGINNIDDIALLKLGQKSYFDPYMTGIQAPMNSDFFPYVDQHAVKARFLRTTVTYFSHNKLTALPYVEILDQKYNNEKITSKNYSDDLVWAGAVVKQSNNVFNILANEHLINPSINHYDRLELDAVIANMALKKCSSNVNRWFESFRNVVLNIIPLVSQKKLQQYWEKMRKNKCFNNLSINQQLWVNLLIAHTNRNSTSIFEYSEKLLNTSSQYKGYLLASYMVSGIVENEYLNVVNAWDKYQKDIALNNRYYSLTKIFYMLAAENL